MADGGYFTNKDGDIVEYDDLPRSTQKLMDEFVGNAETASEIGRNRYENVALPKELKGNVSLYRENIFESPIETGA